MQMQQSEQDRWREDLEELIRVLKELQNYNHPFYAPFVAMTCRGLRQLATKGTLYERHKKKER